MRKLPARFLGSAIRGSIASAIGVIVLAHPAAASLLEFTFTSTFSGVGSFFLETSVQTQPHLGPYTPYPNAIKDYQYKDLFQSISLLETNLFIWADQTPVQGLPSLTAFNIGSDEASVFLNLNLANQPSLGFQLSSDPALYQLNSFWASLVNNSPSVVTSLEVVSVVPEPSTGILAGTVLAGLGVFCWRRFRRT